MSWQRVEGYPGSLPGRGGKLSPVWKTDGIPPSMEGWTVPSGLPSTDPADSPRTLGALESCMVNCPPDLQHVLAQAASCPALGPAGA